MTQKDSYNLKFNNWLFTLINTKTIENKNDISEISNFVYSNFFKFYNFCAIDDVPILQSLEIFNIIYFALFTSFIIKNTSISVRFSTVKQNEIKIGVVIDQGMHVSLLSYILKEYSAIYWLNILIFFLIIAWKFMRYFITVTHSNLYIYYGL